MAAFLSVINALMTVLMLTLGSPQICRLYADFAQISQQTFRGSLLCPSLAQGKRGFERKSHICISLQLTGIAHFLLTPAQGTDVLFDNRKN